jgi:hypothetical protein
MPIFVKQGEGFALETSTADFRGEIRGKMWARRAFAADLWNAMPSRYAICLIEGK